MTSASFNNNAIYSIYMGFAANVFLVATPSCFRSTTVPIIFQIFVVPNLKLTSSTVCRNKNWICKYKNLEKYYIGEHNKYFWLIQSSVTIVILF